MKLTRQNILDLNPCREGLVFARSHDFDAVKIYQTCPRGDWLIWLLRRTNTITKPQAVLLAVTCAEHVLEIFEKKYPGEKRPRLAIDSVKNWLANPTDENRKTCRTNSADAADAAAAYVAAYVAAYDAAAYAADAAADAADAAAAYGAAYVAAYDAAAYAAAAAAAYVAAYVAAYDAAAYAAAAAADAAYAADDAAYAADDAAAYAAYAAADAAARTEECQWQADKIREIIPCPFEN